MFMNDEGEMGELYIFQGLAYYGYHMPLIEVSCCSKTGLPHRICNSLIVTLWPCRASPACKPHFSIILWPQNWELWPASQHSRCMYTIVQSLMCLLLRYSCCYPFHAVTERVWEVVSTDASENEEEILKPKRTEVQMKTEKRSPPKQTKQASLTSFFKR